MGNEASVTSAPVDGSLVTPKQLDQKSSLMQLPKLVLMINKWLNPSISCPGSRACLAGVPRCVVLLDNQEVGNTECYPSPPLYIRPKRPDTNLTLRFFPAQEEAAEDQEPPDNSGLAEFTMPPLEDLEQIPSEKLVSEFGDSNNDFDEELHSQPLSDALVELTFQINLLIQFGLPLYTSMCLGLPLTGDVVDLERALSCRMDPDAAKVYIELFKPSRTGQSGMPCQDIASALAQEDDAVCGVPMGGDALAIPSTVQVQGVIDCMKANNFVLQEQTYTIHDLEIKLETYNNEWQRHLQVAGEKRSDHEVCDETAMMKKLKAERDELWERIAREEDRYQQKSRDYQDLEQQKNSIQRLIEANEAQLAGAREENKQLRAAVASIQGDLANGSSKPKITGKSNVLKIEEEEVLLPSTNLDPETLEALPVEQLARHLHAELGTLRVVRLKLLHAETVELPATSEDGHDLQSTETAALSNIEALAEVLDNKLSQTDDGARLLLESGGSQFQWDRGQRAVPVSQVAAARGVVSRDLDMSGCGSPRVPPTELSLDVPESEIYQLRVDAQPELDDQQDEANSRCVNDRTASLQAQLEALQARDTAQIQAYEHEIASAKLQIKELREENVRQRDQLAGTRVELEMLREAMEGDQPTAAHKECQRKAEILEERLAEAVAELLDLREREPQRLQLEGELELLNARDKQRRETTKRLEQEVAALKAAADHRQELLREKAQDHQASALAADLQITGLLEQKKRQQDLLAHTMKELDLLRSAWAGRSQDLQLQLEHQGAFKEASDLRQKLGDANAELQTLRASEVLRQNLEKELSDTKKELSKQPVPLESLNSQEAAENVLQDLRNEHALLREELQASREHAQLHTQIHDEDVAAGNSQLRELHEASHRQQSELAGARAELEVLQAASESQERDLQSRELPNCSPHVLRESAGLRAELHMQRIHEEAQCDLHRQHKLTLNEELGTLRDECETNQKAYAHSLNELQAFKTELSGQAKDFHMRLESESASLEATRRSQQEQKFLHEHRLAQINAEFHQTFEQEVHLKQLREEVNFQQETLQQQVLQQRTLSCEHQAELTVTQNEVENCIHLEQTVSRLRLELKAAESDQLQEDARAQVELQVIRSSEEAQATMHRQDMAAAVRHIADLTDENRQHHVEMESSRIELRMLRKTWELQSRGLQEKLEQQRAVLLALKDTEQAVVEGGAHASSQKLSLADVEHKLREDSERQLLQLEKELAVAKAEMDQQQDLKQDLAKNRGELDRLRVRVKQCQALQEKVARLELELASALADHKVALFQKATMESEMHTLQKNSDIQMGMLLEDVAAAKDRARRFHDENREQQEDLRKTLTELVSLRAGFEEENQALQRKMDSQRTTFRYYQESDQAEALRLEAERQLLQIKLSQAETKINGLRETDDKLLCTEKELAVTKSELAQHENRMQDLVQARVDAEGRGADYTSTPQLRMLVPTLEQNVAFLQAEKTYFSNKNAIVHAELQMVYVHEEAHRRLHQEGMTTAESRTRELLDENKELQDQLRHAHADLEKRNASTESQAQGMQIQLESHLAAYRALQGVQHEQEVQSEINERTMQGKLARAETELKTFHEDQRQMLKLERELAVCKTELNQQTDSPRAFSPRYLSESEALRISSEECRGLKENLASLQQDLALTQREESSLTEKKVTLHAELDALHIHNNDEQQKAQDDLSAAHMKIQQLLEEQGENQYQLADTRLNLETTLSNLEGEKRHLQAQLEQQRETQKSLQEAEHEQALRAEASEQVLMLRLARTEAELRVRHDSDEQMVHLEKQLVAAKTQLLHEQKVHSDWSQLKLELESYRETDEQCQRLEDMVSRLEADLASTHGDEKLLSERNNALQSEIDAICKEGEAQVQSSSAMQEQLAHAQAELDTLRNSWESQAREYIMQIERQRGAHLELQEAEHAQALRSEEGEHDLQLKFARADAELQVLRNNEHHLLQVEKDLALAKTEVQRQQALSNDLEQTKAKVESLQTTHLQSQGMHENIIQLEQELAKVNADEEYLVEENQSLQLECKAVCNQEHVLSSKCREEVAAANSQVTERDVQNLMQQQQLGDVHKELETLRATFEGHSRGWQAKIEHIRTSYKNLQERESEQVLQAEESQREVHVKLARANAELQVLRDNNGHVLTLQEELAVRNNELFQQQQLHKHLADTRAELQALRVSDKQRHQLQKEVPRLEQDLVSVREETKHLADRNVTLQSQLQSLHTREHTLRTTVEEGAAAMAATVSEFLEDKTKQNAEFSRTRQELEHTQVKLEGQVRGLQLQLEQQTVACQVLQEAQQQEACKASTGGRALQLQLARAEAELHILRNNGEDFLRLECEHSEIKLELFQMRGTKQELQHAQKELEDLRIDGHQCRILQGAVEQLKHETGSLQAECRDLSTSKLALQQETQVMSENEQNEALELENGVATAKLQVQEYFEQCQCAEVQLADLKIELESCHVSSEGTISALQVQLAQGRAAVIASRHCEHEELLNAQEENQNLRRKLAKADAELHVLRDTGKQLLHRDKELAAAKSELSQRSFLQSDLAQSQLELEQLKSSEQKRLLLESVLGKLEHDAESNQSSIEDLSKKRNNLEQQLRSLQQTAQAQTQEHAVEVAGKTSELQGLMDEKQRLANLESSTCRDLEALFKESNDTRTQFVESTFKVEALEDVIKTEQAHAKHSEHELEMKLVRAESELQVFRQSEAHRLEIERELTQSKRDLVQKQRIQQDLLCAQQELEILKESRKKCIDLEERSLRLRGDLDLCHLTEQEQRSELEQDAASIVNVKVSLAYEEAQAQAFQQKLRKGEVELDRCSAALEELEEYSKALQFQTEQQCLQLKQENTMLVAELQEASQLTQEEIPEVTAAAENESHSMQKEIKHHESNSVLSRASHAIMRAAQGSSIRTCREELHAAESECNLLRTEAVEFQNQCLQLESAQAGNQCELAEEMHALEMALRIQESCLKARLSMLQSAELQHTEAQKLQDELAAESKAAAEAEASNLGTDEIDFRNYIQSLEEALRGQRDHLEARFKDLQANSCQSKAIQDEATQEVQAENKALHSEICALHEAADIASRSAMEEATAQKAQLQQDLVTLQSHYVDMRSKSYERLHSLEAALSELQVEKGLLEKQVVCSSQLSGTSEAVDISGTQRDVNDQTRVEFNTLQATNKELEVKLESLTAQHANSLPATRVATLEAEVAEWRSRSQAGEGDAHEEQLSLLRAECKASTTSIAGLREDKSALQLLVAELRAAYQKAELASGGSAPQTASLIDDATLAMQSQFAEMQTRCEELHHELCESEFGSYHGPSESGGMSNKIILRLFRKLVIERFSHKNSDEISKLLKMDTRTTSIPRSDVDRFLKSYKRFRDEFDMQKAFQKLDPQRTGRLGVDDFQQALAKTLTVDADTANYITTAMQSAAQAGRGTPRVLEDLVISEMDFVRLLNTPEYN